jgi:hypothetical protein
MAADARRHPQISTTKLIYELSIGLTLIAISSIIQDLRTPGSGEIRFVNDAPYRDSSPEPSTASVA